MKTGTRAVMLSETPKIGRVKNFALREINEPVVKVGALNNAYVVHSNGTRDVKPRPFRIKSSSSLSLSVEIADIFKDARVPERDSFSGIFFPDTTVARAHWFHYKRAN